MYSKTQCARFSCCRLLSEKTPSRVMVTISPGSISRINSPPTEVMAQLSDAMIQTFLLDTNDNAQEKFLKKFDNDWKRYNRDLIRKVQDYQKEQGDAQ